MQLFHFWECSCPAKRVNSIRGYHSSLWVLLHFDSFQMLQGNTEGQLSTGFLPFWGNQQAAVHAETHPEESVSLVDPVVLPTKVILPSAEIWKVLKPSSLPQSAVMFFQISTAGALPVSALWKPPSPIPRASPPLSP